LIKFQNYTDCPTFKKGLDMKYPLLAARESSGWKRSFEFADNIDSVIKLLLQLRPKIRRMLSGSTTPSDHNRHAILVGNIFSWF